MNASQDTMKKTNRHLILLVIAAVALGALMMLVGKSGAPLQGSLTSCNNNCTLRMNVCNQSGISRNTCNQNAQACFRSCASPSPSGAAGR